MDFRNIDWSAERPNLTTFANGWAQTVIGAVEPLDERLIAVADALSATHVNGGARVAQFFVEAPPPVAWALARNRLNEFELLQHLFAHPAVLAALPEVADPGSGLAAFHMEGTFVSYGRLAGWISAGGAYKTFDSTDEQALELASEFARAAFGMRFSETFCWVNWKPWTDWFLGIAWDGSFLWFDTRAGVITVLLITDTD